MIIHLDPLIPQEQGIEQASEILIDGGIVACPTESYYALSVDVDNEVAVQRLFSVKRRSPDRPVLILIPSVESLKEYVSTIPPVALRLIRRFWPGGLTLIFEASKKICPLLTGNSGNVGVRLSSHPVATALAQSLQGAVTGTSANISGAPPCRRAEEVMATFRENIDLIIDAGMTAGGAGSTVLDVTVDPPETIRDGMIPRHELEPFIRGETTS
jgi:L-threonylcarbamoyladenylate synthase